MMTRDQAIAALTATGEPYELVEVSQYGDTCRAFLNAPSSLRELYAEGIQSVMVEGGATVHGSFLDAGLVDEVWAFVAPLIIGGSDARPAIAGRGAGSLASAMRLIRPEVEILGDDMLVRGLARDVIQVGSTHSEKEDPCLQEL